MKNLLFIFVSLLALVTTSCDNISIKDLTKDFTGTYHGSDDESRDQQSPLMPVDINPYNATIDIEKINNLCLKIAITLCHPDDTKITFNLDAEIDKNNGEMFVIQDELFNAGVIVPERAIFIENGKGKWTNNGKNLEVTFTENREIEDSDPDNDNLNYKSTHTIIFNEVNTGQAGC